MQKVFFEGFYNVLMLGITEVDFVWLAVLFLSVRLVYGSYLLHSVLMSTKTNAIVKLITISLFLISLAFVQNIVSIVIYRLKRKRKPLRETPSDMMGRDMSPIPGQEFS